LRDAEKNVEELVDMKRRYGVSIAAIICRAHDLKKRSGSTFFSNWLTSWSRIILTEFWRILERALPDWKQRKKELRCKARDLFWCGVMTGG
jgi:hypothetical protein